MNNFSYFIERGEIIGSVETLKKSVLTELWSCDTNILKSEKVTVNVWIEITVDASQFGDLENYELFCILFLGFFFSQKWRRNMLKVENNLFIELCAIKFYWKMKWLLVNYIIFFAVLLAIFVFEVLIFGVSFAFCECVLKLN